MTITQQRRRLPRWSLRTMLLLFIPLCVCLAWYNNIQRRYQQYNEAMDVLNRKGWDANFASGLSHAVVYFRNANATDADLTALVPACIGYAPRGGVQIDKIRLNGSPVSDAALEVFRKAAPNCEVER